MKNGKCGWCGWSRGIPIHSRCIRRPRYDKVDEGTAWLYHPERPTRNGGKKVLNPYEQGKKDEWEIIKEDDVMNDAI